MIKNLESVNHIVEMFKEDQEKTYLSNLIMDWVSKFDDKKIEVMLKNCSIDSLVSTEHRKGFIHGIITMFEFMGFDERTALGEIVKRLPNDFDLECLPAYMIYSDADWEYLKINESKITPFIGLLNQLPEGTTQETIDALKDRYIWECALISAYAKRDAKNPVSYLYPFRQAGSQMIAEFEVRDQAKQLNLGQMNWHGQNTSQWVYAGCILVQDGRVSTHH